MKLLAIIEKLFKSFLPTPFTIALILTLITFILALYFTPTDLSFGGRTVELAEFWYNGLWEQSMLAFALQMMLMLVLGHALALTKPIDRLMSYVTQFCTSTANAAMLVTLLTVLVALFNWGLGLIFGAILARKVGEHAARNNISLNYALIGAAGYSGLMVWHGGLSGSAPIKAAESGHIAKLMEGVVSPSQAALLPDSVSFSETVFGTMNLTAIALLVLILPAFMYFLGKRSSKIVPLPVVAKDAVETDSEDEGVEKVERSRWISLFFGGIILVYVIYHAVTVFQDKQLEFITPDFINSMLLGLCLVLHQNIQAFLKAIDKAIGGSSGILIQFPLYFGIIGIMKYSGLVNELSGFFVSISNQTTFPVFSYISAGIVNVFIPSGGGQWGVQGPVILKGAMELNVSLPKAIMSLAYGDQLTNMMQPFWALPLLGITGLKAKQILPYSVALMLVGGVIFMAVLILF